MPDNSAAARRNQSGSRAETAGWALNWIGSAAGWLLVRAVFAAVVCFQWLDPRVHFERLRIRAVSDGRLVKNSDKLALLVVYCAGPLPQFTRNVVEALNRSEFDLVVLSNAALEGETKSYLLAHSRLLIERANVGRDFGGYKDGIALILRRYPSLQKLLLANDSVYYLPNGLSRLLDELAGEGDFIGVSEIFEHHYHVASFLVSFGRPVLTSAAFLGFWKRYRPISTRRWAILQGEGALTRILLAAGFSPRVLYRTDDLRHKLQGCPVDQLIDEADRLPTRDRQILAAKWNETDRTGPRNAVVIAGDIAGAIRSRNQMHAGGFLFRRHLGMPVVKRDLVYRGIFPLDEALANLGDLDGPLLQAVTADLLSRPDPARFTGLRRLFHRQGSI